MSSMECSSRVCEMTHVIQIYYIKSVNFYADGGMYPAISPLELSLDTELNMSASIEMSYPFRFLLKTDMKISRHLGAILSQFSFD